MTIWPFFKRLVKKFLRIYSGFILSLGFFMVGLFFIHLFCKFQNLSFFKTEFGVFKLQAPGNPDFVFLKVGGSFTDRPSSFLILCPIGILDTD